MVKHHESPAAVAAAWAKSGAKLSTKHLSKNVVLIEGDRPALELLARLIKAQANFGDKDCGFSIVPRSGGGAFFTKDSTRGFYFHVRHDEPLEPPPLKSGPKPSPRTKDRKPTRKARKR
jgi:hypothetical protein